MYHFLYLLCIYLICGKKELLFHQTACSIEIRNDRGFDIFLPRFLETGRYE